MSPGASIADPPLDALSCRLLAAVPDLRVAVAGAGERAAIHRLRREHIVAAGWARAERLPPDGEHDAYDADAVQIGAWARGGVAASGDRAQTVAGGALRAGDGGVAAGGDRPQAGAGGALRAGAGAGGVQGGALVGAIRLVLPARGRLLPVEAEFGVRVQPPGRVAEAGRLVIAAAHRGDPAHRAWGALFARAWLELRARDLSVLAGAASPEMIARLRALGLPFDVLGPAREHWGEARHPVRLDPAGGMPRWYGHPRAPGSGERPLGPTAAAADTRPVR